MEEGDFNKHFGVVDLVIFIALLIGSALVGAFFAYKDRKAKSTDNYYYGDRKLSPFPVAMSMAVSFVSAITVIGYPTEVYLYGMVYAWMIPGICLTTIIVVIYYIPLVHRLKLQTIYEYLELRFNKYVRKLCSGMVVPELLLYMGITVYLPALALEAVTPLSLNVTIAMTSLICTFYTSVGGMKAVIWTDVLQGFVMIFGSLALFIKTAIMVGGIENVVEAVERGGRNNFLKLDPDPRERTTFFTIFFGYSFMSLGTNFSQVYYQRYLSCKSAADATKAAIIRVIPTSLFFLLAIANGLVMYAYFEGCDPTTAGSIGKRDQTTPRLAIEAFYDMPGMAGLFVSAAYSGTLSTVSSGINALAAMSTEDFIKPCWPALAALYGLLVMSVAFVIPLMETTVVQIAAAWGGIIGGSILSVYVMGIFVPWTNSIGAFFGMIIGWCFTGWISLASILHKPAPEFRETLPLTAEACNSTSIIWKHNFTDYANSTTAATTTPIVLQDRDPLADTLYSTSPFLYGVIGFFVGCLAMLIISVFTGMNKASEANPDLFVPLLDSKKIFPRSVVKFFRLGVPERTCDEKFVNGAELHRLTSSTSPEKDCLSSSLDSVANKLQNI